MDWLHGIDTIAHTYSYNQLGKTIAVLGCGFDNIFPKENITLYKQILDNDGLIVSEYPSNTKHKSEYFLERNRIVSGLSMGILVVEATFRSGTSVTAKLAHMQDRKVFALPHEIWNTHGIGTNTLIRNGAIVVTDTEDILEEFKSLQSLVNQLNNIKKIQLNHSDLELPSSVLSTNLSNASDNSISLQKKKLENSKYEPIYSLISTKPISINEICKITSKSISEVSNCLFFLELEGYIKKVSGGYVCILEN